VKGTRLWSQPRSPLIQGRSRRERPFWADWLASFAIGATAGALVAGTLLAPVGAGFVAGAEALAVPTVLASAGGAALGVTVASGFGWHPRWAAGSTLAAVAAVVAAWAAQAL